jgi:hypothetical protein
MSKDENDGVKMIQYLQKLAGIDEPVVRALRNWRGMTANDKANTAAAYRALGGEEHAARERRRRP